MMQTEKLREEKTSSPPNSRSCPADPTIAISAAKVVIEEINTRAAKTFMNQITSDKLKGSVCFQVSQQIAGLSEITLAGTVHEVLLDEHKSLYRSGIPSTHSSNTAIENFEFESIPYFPERRKFNVEWVQKYIKSLNELKHFPFRESDLWEMQQYFFSPVQPRNYYSTE